MKAGQFAKQHGISQSTLNYYIKLGLLLPATVNGKYDFREADERDMRLIQNLKQWQFSLRDMETLLSYLRLTQDSTRPDLGRFQDMLHRQQQRLLAEKAAIERSLTSLSETVEALQASPGPPPAAAAARGVDVRFLPYFYCPKCARRLNVALQDIQNGEIDAATLSCDCGYTATIQDGILINPGGEELPSPADLSNYTLPEQLPLPVRKTLFRIYAQLEKMLQEEDLKDKLLIETHIGAGSFLLQRAKQLNPDALYVLCDPVQATVAREKAQIDALGLPLTTLTIASNYFHFPLRQGSADYAIDCFTNSYFSMLLGRYLFPLWLRYFHKGSQIVGVFLQLPPNSRSFAQFRALYPTAGTTPPRVEAFQAALAEHGFSIEQEHWMEPLRASHFRWHHEGDELQYYCYKARLNREPESGDRAESLQ